MEIAYPDLVELMTTYKPTEATFYSYAGARLRGAIIDEIRSETRRYHRENVWVAQTMTMSEDFFEERLDVIRAAERVGQLYPDMLTRDLDMLTRVVAGFDAKEAGEAWGLSRSAASRGVHRAECAMREFWL